MKTKNVLTLVVLSVILQVISATAGEYFFHLHDHLGNTRVVVDVNKNVVERYDYYPFGLVSRSSVSSDIETIQKFTGKELDDEHGVELYYFGARYHDPVTGRFVGVDPLAAKYPSLSPYNYCANNPNILVDPDGRFIDTIADIAFVAYDLYDIGHTFASGSSPSATQWLGLGGDIVGALVPFATGLGAGVKALDKADDLIDAAQAIDKANDNKKVLRGTQNPHVKQKALEGIKKHKEYNPGKGFQKEVNLGNGNKADAMKIEGDKGIIKELKPNNPSAIKKGEKQLKRYKKAAEKKYPNVKEWETKVDTYDNE